MKNVYAARNPGDAHLMKGVLEGEGIKGDVQGEFLWGVRGEVPIIPETCPSVWVDDSDYERAIELVSAFRPNGRPIQSELEEWKCSKCGEFNEEQFTECWQCGTSRPAGD